MIFNAVIKNNRPGILYLIKAPIIGVLIPVNVYNNIVNNRAGKIICFLANSTFLKEILNLIEKKITERNKMKFSMIGNMCIVFLMSVGSGLKNPLNKPTGNN